MHAMYKMTQIRYQVMHVICHVTIRTSTLVQLHLVGLHRLSESVQMQSAV